MQNDKKRGDLFEFWCHMKRSRMQENHVKSIKNMLTNQVYVCSQNSSLSLYLC